MDKQSLQKMDEVETFLEKTVSLDEERTLHMDPDSVNAMYAYSSALVRGAKDKFIGGSWSSTDNELFLKYRIELILEFDLLILTKEEGERRERELKKIMHVYKTDTSFFN